MIDQQEKITSHVSDYSSEAIVKKHLTSIQTLSESATKAGISPDQFNQLVQFESEKMNAFLNEETTRQNLALMEKYKQSNVFHEGRDNQNLPYLLLIAKKHHLNSDCFQGSRSGDVLITPRGINWITSGELIGFPGALDSIEASSYDLNEIINGQLETPNEKIGKYLPYNSQISHVLDLRTNETTPVAVVREPLNTPNQEYVAKLIDFAKEHN